MLLMWSATDATSGGQADMQAWADFQAAATEAGVYLDGGAFQAPADARTVRTSIAGYELPDAAFAGTFTKGPVQLAAYYLVECRDIDHAVEWANRLPTYGEVEVRELIAY